MKNKNSIIIIAATVFCVVIVMVLAKGLIGSEVDKMEDRNFALATEQFLDFRAYKDGENPFPVTAHFYTPAKEKVTIKNYKGRYVLLNFWATWCPGCVKELPSLHNLNEIFKQGDYAIELIALSMDRERTQTELVDFLFKYDVGPFALYHDTDRRITRAYPLKGMPTTLLIDPEGDVIYEFLGEADWTERNLVTFLIEEIEAYTAMQKLKKSL